MEKLQLLAMIQAYTGIGIGLIIGLGALGACHRRRPHVLDASSKAPRASPNSCPSCRPRCSCCSA